MTAALLRGVDLAAFAVALVARLHTAGVRVSASGPAGFVAAMAHLVPRAKTDLYWAARLTLVNRADDLPAFDAVFRAVFDDAITPLDPAAREAQRGRVRAAQGRPLADGPASDGTGVPWVTRPATLTATPGDSDGPVVPDALPSRLVARTDEPFEAFDADDLRLLGTWLERSAPRWPHRRSMRHELDRRGRRVDLRHTLAASRKTGWEPLTLARTRRRRRPRRVVMLCDVSRSMQPSATMYLHLMRALARGGPRPEVFAFATTLTRLTAVLGHRSPEVALERANAAVTDRFGGTHLGRSVAGVLAPPHGNKVRGAVVVIVSDGWDADEPDVLARGLARLRRRAHTVVWLNPRAAQPGYRPLAGAMAAALPFCDHLLPAQSLAGLRELFDVLATARRQVR